MVPAVFSSISCAEFFVTVDAGRQTVVGRGFLDQARHGRLAAVRDRAHILEHADRTQGVLSLTDTRPRQLIVIARRNQTVPTEDWMPSTLACDSVSPAASAYCLHGFAEPSSTAS